MGNGVIAPLFFTSVLDVGDWSASLPSRFTPGIESPVPIGEEAGQAPEPVWTLWRRGKYLQLLGIEPRTSSLQPVSIPTALAFPNEYIFLKIYFEIHGGKWSRAILKPYPTSIFPEELENQEELPSICPYSQSRFEPGPPKDKIKQRYCSLPHDS
jgi:hypothetical protein